MEVVSDLATFPERTPTTPTILFALAIANRTNPISMIKTLRKYENNDINDVLSAEEKASKIDRPF